MAFALVACVGRVVKGHQSSFGSEPRSAIRHLSRGCWWGLSVLVAASMVGACADGGRSDGENGADTHLESQSTTSVVESVSTVSGAEVDDGAETDRGGAAGGVGLVDPEDAVGTVVEVPGVGWVEMSSLQEEILADGVVTEEEMFAAMQATVECVQRHGFHASLVGQGPGEWATNVSAADSAEMAQASDMLDLCTAAYSERAQWRYMVGHLSPDANPDVVWDCLLERGVLDGSVSDYTIAFQLAEASNPDVTWECIFLGRDG